jgi:hypothetical protein
MTTKPVSASTVDLGQGDLSCHTRAADVTLQPTLRRGAPAATHPSFSTLLD